MATLNKRGKSYVLNWREGGRQFRRSLGPISQREAEAVLEIRRAELKTGMSFVKEQGASVLLSEYAPDYLDWHRAEYPSSYTRISQIVSQHLLPTFGHVLMDRIEPRSVEQWKAIRNASGVKPATISKELKTLKAILNHAVKYGVIERHRIAVVSEPKNLESRPPPYYSKGELNRIYASAIKYGAVWQFMANTGLRRGEMLEAKRQDIVKNQLRVLSSNKSRTKSGKWRLVPLNAGALAVLDQLDFNGYLAPRLYTQSLSRAFVNDTKRARLNGSIHWLRHSFCSHLVMAGVDIRTIQELAGHASINTTLNYCHLSAKHLVDAVEGLML